MKLDKILEGLEYEILSDVDVKDIDVDYVDSDSRNIVENSLFVCVDGTRFDGHNYILDAISKGAKVIVVTKEIDMIAGVCYIKIKDSRCAMPIIADNFYEHPSKKLKVIGVTGTKGKTTTTFMLKHIFEEAGYSVGLIGTVGNYIRDKKISEDRTTPQPIELQRMFFDMISDNIDVVIMEVSSHALDLHRVDRVNFNVGIFTNLSQDHLDYHKTFENYFEAKRKLFGMCDIAVINVDDDYGKRLYDMCECSKISFGIKNKADYMADNIEFGLKGTLYRLKNAEGERNIELSVPGEFSVYNSLGAISSAKAFNVDDEFIFKGLKETLVPGRAQIVKSDKDFSVMVDYAHSPGSLESILKALKVFCKGRVISVFGCGGDRDALKRPIMGRISGELADFTVLTSDNPRTENPTNILKQIEEGIKETKGEYVVIESRQEAIKYAINIAKKDDIVLLAGKGHEPYQEVNGIKHHFDDVEEAKKFLDKLD